MHRYVFALAGLLIELSMAAGIATPAAVCLALVGVIEWVWVWGSGGGALASLAAGWVLIWVSMALSE